MTKKKKIVLATLAAVILSFGLSGTSSSAFASDYANWRFPLYEGVERIYLYVKYYSAVNDENLPPVLRKENIESLLLRMYQERFSSEKCMHIDGKNPYGCNDQPVRLLTDREWGGYRSRELLEERKKTGSLTVVLSLRIYGPSPNDDPPLKEPLVALYTIQDRPDSDFLMDWVASSKFAEVFPLNQPDENITARLVRHIDQRIK